MKQSTGDIKLSKRQKESLEYLREYERVFTSFNCYLHSATVKFLIKNGLAKRIGGGYVSLTELGKTIQL